MNVVNRAKAPTPKFFKILRTIGLALLGISGSVIAAPVALPAAVVTAAGTKRMFLAKSKKPQNVLNIKAYRFLQVYSFP